MMLMCRDKNRMTEILNMHIIKERLNVDKIKQKNANMVSTNSNITKIFVYLTFLLYNSNRLLRCRR